MVREVKQDTKTTQVIAIAFGCLPERKGKILLLKIQPSFVVGHRKMRLTWKFPPRWLASVRLDGAMQATGVWGVIHGTA